MDTEHYFTNLLLGTDLVHAPRLAGAYRRFGRPFLERILNPAEIAHCLEHGRRDTHVARRLAGKIALKEAVSKALGIGLNGLGWGQGASWKEIEIAARNRQAPDIVLSGVARERAERLGIRAWRVSVSHDGEYATATAIGLVFVKK